MITKGHFLPCILGFLLHLLSGTAFQYKDIFSSWLILFIIRNGLLKRRLKAGLMLFGQFLADSDFSISKLIQKLLKCLHKAVGSFIDDTGAGLCLQFFQNSPALLFIGR